jgi:hypothetical protein
MRGAQLAGEVQRVWEGVLASPDEVSADGPSVMSVPDSPAAHPGRDAGIHYWLRAATAGRAPRRRAA